MGRGRKGLLVEESRTLTGRKASKGTSARQEPLHSARLEGSYVRLEAHTEGVTASVQVLGRLPGAELSHGPVHTEKRPTVHGGGIEPLVRRIPSPFAESTTRLGTPYGQGPGWFSVSLWSNRSI